MLKTSGAVVAAREEWRRRARRGRRSCIVLSVTEEPDNNGNSSNSCSPGAWQNSRTWQLRMYDEAPACFLSSLPFIQIRKTFMQSAPSAMNAIHVYILQCMQHIFCDICNIYFAIYAQYILHYMQYIFCIICNIYFAINIHILRCLQNTFCQFHCKVEQALEQTKASRCEESGRCQR